MNVGLTADVGVLVTPLINALLDTIRTDIQNDQRYSDEKKTKCEAVLNQLEQDSKTSYIQFLKDTRDLCDKTLELSTTERDSIQKAWIQVFEIYRTECKDFIRCTLLYLFQWKKNVESLRWKRGVCRLALPTIPIIVGAALYKWIDINLTSMLAGDFVVSLFPAWIIYSKTSTLGREINDYNACIERVPLLLKKYPLRLTDSLEVIEKQLDDISDDIFNTLKITNEVWHCDITLNLLRTRITDVLQSFQR